jgi:hypothetical protein
VSELHKLTALTRLDVVFVPDVLPAYEESINGLAAITQVRPWGMSGATGAIALGFRG